MADKVSCSKEVGYKIRYDSKCSDKNPPKDLVIPSGPKGMNALDIMKYAVDHEGSDYQFSATYFKSLGFFIDKLNGTESCGPCYWAVYIVHSDGTEEKSKRGVSSLQIEVSQSLMMKYEK